MTHEESQFPTTVCRNISDEDQLVYARTTGGYDLQDQLEGQGCLRESRSRLQQNQDYERHREAYEAASWHPRQFLEHQGLGQPEQGRFRGQFYKNQKDSRAPTSGGVRAPAINAGLLYKEDLVYTETAQDQRETRAHMRKNSIFKQPAVDENVQYDAEVRTMLPEVPIRTTPSQAQKTRGQVLGHLALKGKVAQGTVDRRPLSTRPTAKEGRQEVPATAVACTTDVDDEVQFNFRTRQRSKRNPAANDDEPGDSNYLALHENLDADETLPMPVTVTASSLRDGMTRRPQSKKLVMEEPARTLRKLHVDSGNETPAERRRKLPPIAKIREEQQKPKRVQTEKVGSYLEKRYSYSEEGLPLHRASLTEKEATHPSRKEEYYDVSSRVARHEEQSPERN